MKNQYVLEWSQKTNNFHIQPLANLLAHNQTAFVDNKPVPDYIVLMVSDKDAVHAMADSWRTRLVERKAMQPVKAAI
jgi:hypothetical protein